MVANAAHGLAYGPVGAIVAAWPALALVGSCELLMLMVRNIGRREEPAPASENAAEPVSEARPIALVVPATTGARDERQVQAENEFADELAVGHAPTIREVRARLRVGQPRAQQVRTHLLSLLADGEPA